MGQHSIIIKDESIGREVKNSFVLELLNQNVTVADIIRERVRYEVEAHNRKSNERRFHGLIQPTDTETTLNGYELKRRRRIDIDRQIDTALKAFQGNGFFILIDDQQVEALDQVIALRPDMEVTFIKLTPLVGG